MSKKLTLLEKKRKEKEKVKYNLIYKSSAFKTNKATLGTIENDAAGSTVLDASVNEFDLSGTSAGHFVADDCYGGTF